jgi:hypothetical protein
MRLQKRSKLPDVMYLFPNTYYTVSSSISRSKNHLSCQGDNIGPVVHGHRNDFDFTLLLENTIISMIPSAIMIFLTVARISYLQQQPKVVVSAKRLQLLKLVRGLDLDIDNCFH